MSTVYIFGEMSHIFKYFCSLSAIYENAHVRLEQVGKMKNVRLEQLFVRLEQVGLGQIVRTLQKETILQEVKCEKNGRQAEKSRGSYKIIIYKM